MADRRRRGMTPIAFLQARNGTDDPGARWQCRGMG